MNSTTAIAILRPVWQVRARDYLELTRPRIATLVLVTTAVSLALAQWGNFQWLVLLHTLVGTGLVAASASAINQWIERRSDAEMPRTAERPLPAGRLSGAEVLTLGTVALVLGSVYLALAVGWEPAVWALATWLIYIALYTPLKSKTQLNTAVGAVSGALPVFIGWSAAGMGGSPLTDLRAWGLFTVLFLWQFPHFMAIAWLYRDDYRRAGLQMASVVDPSGGQAGWQSVWGAVLLLPVSLVPALAIPGSSAYMLLACLLGVLQLAAAVAFWRRRDNLSARRLLRATLIYIPALFFALLLVPLL